MIEKMKKTAVLCQARHRDEVLGSLRDLGVMHLSDTPSHSQGLDALMAERESVVRTMQVLSERGGKGVAGRADGDFAAVDGEVQRLIAEEAALQGRIAALSSERERISLLGSFDPDAFRSLVDMGIFNGIWIGSDKDMKALAASEGVRFIEVAAEGKQRAAVILSGDIPEGRVALIMMPGKFNHHAQGITALGKKFHDLLLPVSAGTREVFLSRNMPGFHNGPSLCRIPAEEAPCGMLRGRIMTTMPDRR